MHDYHSELRDKFTKPPIIIGGCGRSGTTLLLSILSAHPNIFGIPFETRAFCPNVYKDFSSDTSINLKEIHAYFLDRHIPLDSRWCEKTPKNILFIGEILKFFNDRVRILNVVRDGRDVILSRHPENQETFWVTPQRWISDVQAGLRFENHPNVMTVRYEDLVLQFDSTIKEICNFIQEDCSNKLLNWYENTKIKNHEAWFKSAGPIYTHSIGKFREAQYKKRINKFMNQSTAMSLLRHYRYVN